MKRKLLYITLLISSFCFSQNELDKEKALLNLAATKNAIVADTIFKSYVKQGLFKNRKEYSDYATKKFNEFYSKKDTINTLYTFKILGLGWARKGKFDSILKMKPIVPLLSKNVPINLIATTKSVLSNCLFYINTNPKKARKYSDESIQLFEKVNDSSYSAWATVHALRIDDASKSNDFSSIIPHALAAMKLHRYQKNYERLNALNSSLSVSYSLNGLFEPAKVLRNESILYNSEIRNYSTLIIDYLNAALDEKLQGNYTLQQEYLDKAIATAALFNVDHYSYICYHSYVVFASQQDKVALTNTYFKKIKAVYPKFKNSVFHRILFLEAQAYHQYVLKNYTKAEKYALEKLKLSESFNSKEILQEAHELLELIYTASRQTAKAKEQNYSVLKYLNNTKENSLKNQLVYYQTLYETEKRDLTIKNQQANIALLDVKNKVKTQWLLFGGLGLLSIFGFVWIIRSRNFARNKQKLQEKFSQDILNTQEEERSRVAKELHDGVGQQLLVLKNTFLQKETQEKEEITLLENTIREVREISHNLYPFQFKKLGLVKSLEHLVDAFQKSSPVFYSYDIEDISGRISKEKELFIYRMLQECISNVEKHAQATACNLTVKTKSNQIYFQLKDNGKGFSVETINTTKTSLGIRSLKERAQYMNAELDIKSIKEKGTTIIIKITD